MSTPAEIKALLNDPNRLKTLAKSAFDAVDRDRSGFIDEVELYQVMTKVAKAVGSAAPTKQQVNAVIAEIDSNRDGRVAFDEYLLLVRKTLLKMIGEDEPVPSPRPKPAPPVVEERPAPEVEHLHNQAALFDKYLEDSGLTMAFQLIYSEIITKKVEPGNVFTYTAMRLRQLGKEIAHLLPKNLTAGLPQE
mmetsp:Transcript_22641/g.40746  ORF Transcript_22641/g.40746 Transcript_22641/m.40746 type:complete len:191 (-) Transcript_22641:56-628(-)